MGIAAAMEGSSCGADSRCGQSMTYLEHLARMLACLHPTDWLLNVAAWTEVMRLAFCYLDVDHDGVLNLNDLLFHFNWRLPSGSEKSPAMTPPMSMRRWLSHW